jgi:hypothetical protein
MVKEIIVKERVTTLDDLLKRRLSMIEDPKDLKEVLGLKIDEVKNLF